MVFMMWWGWWEVGGRWGGVNTVVVKVVMGSGNKAITVVVVVVVEVEVEVEVVVVVMVKGIKVNKT